MKTLLFVIFVICLLPDFQTVSARDIWVVSIDGQHIEAEIAQTPEQQQLGLGNRFSLPVGQGMLFLYDDPGVRIFWMKRMSFSIDIIWLRNNKIVHIRENVPPPRHGTPDDQLKRYGYGVLADMVLELPAGYVKRNRVSPQSLFTIEKRD